MREIDIIQKLNRKAGTETAPPVDVTSRVMMRLRAGQEPAEDPVVFRFLQWLTAFSSAIAVLAAAVIFLSSNEWTDPLIALLFEIQ